MSQYLSRRTLLKGMGAAVALPWLEAMGPLHIWTSSQATEATRRVPARMAFVYVPNGVNMTHWRPGETGALGQLPRILEPLNNVKGYVNVITGLTADKARANGDGAGDHARAMAAFLTGSQPRKTDGADIRAGISVDQVAASRIAEQTRLPSLEIGADPSAMAGNCDSGYSCVYSSTISWRSATSPVPKLHDPRLVFDRLFGSGNTEERARRDRQRQSILDFVREDATSIAPRLSSNDRRKLDEYFTSIRDIEQRIERARRLPAPAQPAMARPQAMPSGRDAYQEHLRILSDLVVLAFQADITRVSTFVFANEGSNRSYSAIGVPEGHHDLSHHGGNQAKLDKILQINRFHMQQFAYFIDKLKNTPEAGGNLLDHSMVAYGSGNSDGNRHNHDDLPVLLVGRGCGTIRTGRHMVYPRETPLNNLWLSMLDRINAPVDRLGDSTGRLTGLEA